MLLSLKCFTCDPEKFKSCPYIEINNILFVLRLLTSFIRQLRNLIHYLKQISRNKNWKMKIKLKQGKFSNKITKRYDQCKNSYIIEYFT